MSLTQLLTIQDGLLIAPNDIQDARHDLHRFYDLWFSHHKELATLLDNKNSTGVDLFIAKYPNFDNYTDIIERHVECCHDLIHSSNFTPYHYNQLHGCLWSGLMNITWLKFRNETCLPDVPTIYTNTPDPINIENHRVTFADKQLPAF